MMDFRKILALVLSIVMVFSLLVSCGGEEKPDDEIKDPAQNGENKPDDGEKEEGDQTPAFTPIAVKNELDLIDVTQRLFYPDHALLIQKLETAKQNLDTTFADPATLRGYLQSLYRDAQGLGIYADYIGNTSLSAGDTVYGATADDYAIGGGKGYPKASDKYSAIATDDDTLKVALQLAQAGDVILIRDDITIDMTDWLIGGEVEGFTATSGTIKYEMVIPEGVTLMGMRGTDGKSGGIIKLTSYTNIAFRLEKDARLSGLCILGPDTPANASISAGNFSVGIAVVGDNARIDNCEISGFYDKAILVENAQNVQIDHNYFHHLPSEKSVAVYLKNASANIHHNILSQVSTAVSFFGSSAEADFTNNVTVSDYFSSQFITVTSVKKDDTYKKAPVGPKRLTVKNNTFLSPSNLMFALSLIPALTVENNIFAYGTDLYADGLTDISSVDASIYDTAKAKIKNNVYDIQNPKVYSKTKDGLKEESVSLTAFVPEEKKVPAVNVKLSAPTVLCSNYYYEKNDAPYQTMKAVIETDDANLAKAVKAYVNSIISDIGGFTNYLDYVDADKINFEVDGQVYGAQADDKGNVGGGVGYFQIFSEKDADFVVKNKSELLKAIRDAKKGDVIYIPEGVVIDISDASKGSVSTLQIDKQITICSNRGYVHEDGRVSTGGVIACATMGKSMVNITGDGARISGVVLRGPDPSNHLSHHRHAFSMGYFDPYDPDDVDHKYYNRLRTSGGIGIQANNVEVDNCELSGFSATAMSFGPLDDEYKVASTGGLSHHNFIHHNQTNGLGYGVGHSAGYSKIYNNLFNYNRHSIQGTGHPNSGYDAYNNIELGQSLSDFFDMHGGSDRKDGTDIAGEYCYIYNNTYLGANNPYNIRGVVVKDRTFDYNAVFNSRVSYGTYLTHARYGTGAKLENVKVGKNLWGISGKNPKVQAG